MKKYLGSIIQLFGAVALVLGASMLSTAVAVSLGGILLIFLGIALERRLD